MRGCLYTNINEIQKSLFNFNKAIEINPKFT